MVPVTTPSKRSGLSDAISMERLGQDVQNPFQLQVIWFVPLLLLTSH